MDGPGLAWRAFCLVGFASSRNGVSKREREGSGSLLVDYCVGQDKVWGSQMLCRREGLKEPSGRTKMAVDERCQVPRVWWMCSGGACRFGVHEDGWMRWVAVEPCHLELRVSLGRWPWAVESPFSILHPDLWAQGVRDTAVVHSFYLNPILRSGLVQIEMSPGLPRTG